MLLDLTHLTTEEALKEASAVLLSMTESQRRQQRRQLYTLFPDDGPLRRELYPKHLEFFAAGARVRERVFIAGNRTGKTVGAGTEWAYHLMGQYPSWWKGHRYTKPIRLLVSGNTHETTRDILQLKMLGSTTDRPELMGTGIIPAENLVSWQRRSHINGAVEKAVIKSAWGGESEIWFRSYEQGREIFEGIELDGFWPDEEVDEKVFDEGTVRLMTTKGHSTLTFTPLKGLTPLVIRMLERTEDSDRLRAVIQCGWDDVPHLSEEDKVDMLARLPPHIRDARSRGIPSLGAGAIYPIPFEQIEIADLRIPAHWAKGYALDVGWNRTAALWGAWDRESDVIYLYSEHYQGQSEPSLHADAIKARGEWMMGAIDPSARNRMPEDGKKLMQMYRNHRLNLIEANNAVDTGILEVWQRLSSGRLRVFKSLGNFRAEYAIYRRDENGKIVKANDHLMDCMRYLCNTKQVFGLAPGEKKNEHNWRQRAKLTRKGASRGSAQAA